MKRTHATSYRFPVCLVLALGACDDGVVGTREDTHARADAGDTEGPEANEGDDSGTSLPRGPDSDASAGDASSAADGAVPSEPGDELDYCDFAEPAQISEQQLGKHRTARDEALRGREVWEGDRPSRYTYRREISFDAWHVITVLEGKVVRVEEWYFPQDDVPQIEGTYEAEAIGMHDWRGFPPRTMDELYGDCLARLCVDTDQLHPDPVVMTSAEGALLHCELGGVISSSWHIRLSSYTEQ